MEFNRVKRLRGEITVPGDKSISHRSIMLGAIAQGTTTVTNFLTGADCLSTISCFRNMGVEIEQEGGRVRVHGNGMRGLKPPTSTLNVGNSGTTTRLLSGILAAQRFDSRLDGDASIRKRPMGRVITPLRQMGAELESETGNDCAPLLIRGRALKAISYASPVASAQVKSCVLLAGLYADGETKVTEPERSRDHTERMLSAFGADVSVQGKTVCVRAPEQLYAQDIVVPGDISSAVYWIVAGLITPDSEITIRNVGLNPTRDGILEVCRNMNAQLEVTNMRQQGSEPVGDITVRTSELKATRIGGSVIPRLIDELPTMALLACFAKGDTVICDAQELKVKESDRIAVMVDNLRRMGADVEGTSDGMVIHGPCPLRGAEIDSQLDHRIAMTFAVAGCNADGTTRIRGAECVDISYPAFYSDLKKLSC